MPSSVAATTHHEQDGGFENSISAEGWTEIREKLEGSTHDELIAAYGNGDF